MRVEVRIVMVAIFMLVSSSLLHAASRELDAISLIYQQGDAKTASAQLKNYLKTHEGDDLAWTILGHAHKDLDNDQAAEAAYLKALKINPKRIEAITGMGILSRRKGNYDAAMDYYQKAVSLDPQYAQAYSSMVVIALKQEKDKDALAYARKAFDLDDEDPVIIANLAMAYHYNGMTKERDKMTKKAIKAGYRGGDKLEKIYSGEFTIRD